MKTYFSVALLCSQALAVSAFMAPAQSRSKSCATSTQRFMFGGAGAGSPTEDDDDANPEAEAGMENAAAAMGMSAAEYKLAMRAREQLVKSMDAKIVTTGDADTVLIERDVNNPPKKLDITITEAGKALGADALSKKLVDALGKGTEKARKGRQECQQEMLKWVQSQG
eukprot:jgi/Psemu1/305043/fgenesh1_kg.180_\